MNIHSNINDARRQARRMGGSVLVIVMWITFGLICITLYFANSMSLGLRSADNRAAGSEADQATEGAARYLTLVLSNLDEPGVMPDGATYMNAAAPVGNAKFWLIGRGLDSGAPTAAHFGLIDEASKININVATSNILVLLPRMTPELVANITAWRSTNTTSTAGGAESDSYMRLASPYMCKNAPFETLDELRLIYDMDMTTLYGEDANLNGILDSNEDDADKNPPTDNKNGLLEPGLMEYVTVYSREPSTTTNGTARFNITTYTPANRAQLIGVLTNGGFETARVTEILSQAGNGPFSSPIEFYIRSKMSAQEFAKVEDALRGTRIQGLLNVNTASTVALSCIPGLDNGQAAQLTAYRQSNTNNLNSIAWITQVLSQSDAITAGPWLTGKGYQFMADVAAVGHEGRGYRRTRFVFDTSSTNGVKILYRQDLTHLGWALGKDVRKSIMLAKDNK